MQKSQIIEAADALSERKVDQAVLSLDTELNLGIQELLQENRFWWSKKRVTFATVSGTASYDLTSTSIVSGAIGDISEIINVLLVDSSGNVSELVPIFETADQEAAIQETTPAEPSSWFIDPSTYGTIRFQAPADGVYSIYVWYWAGHDFVPSAGGTSDTVPVVPPWLHYGLVTMLKMRIFDFLYGQKDPRYLTAVQQYGRFLKQANRKPSFSTQRVRGHGENIEAVVAS